MTTPAFTIRTPVDLIAMAPLVLGFHPEDSVVLLTFGAPGRQFQARVDLPVTADDRAAVVDLLVRPVVKHRIELAALLVYGDDAEAAASTAADLVPALEGVGASLLEVLRVDGDCYHRILDPDGLPVPYDISAHEFAAEAVLLGRQTMASRADLADRLVGGRPEEVDLVREAAAAAADDRSDRSTEASWIRQTIRQWRSSRQQLSTPVAGRLLMLLDDIELRDVAWAEIDHDGCAQLQDLWTDLVRRCPDELLPAPAGLLAFAAWLEGNGALAWCAIDRCLGADPGYSMGHALGALLEEAVPPQLWQSIRTPELGALSPQGFPARDQAS